MSSTAGARILVSAQQFNAKVDHARSATDFWIKAFRVNMPGYYKFLEQPYNYKAKVCTEVGATGPWWEWK